jgi:hypothetical protein
MKTLHHTARAVVLATLAWSGGAGADAVTDWNEIAVGSVSVGRPGAIGIVDLGLIQAAAHDAIQSYEHRFEPYYAEVPNAKGSKSAAVAAAVHGVLVGFYPTQATTLDTTYTTWLANNGLTGNAGIAVGDEVAARYLPLRRLDPNPLPPPFVGPDPPEVGKWRPTESFNGGPPPGPPPSFAPMAFPWVGSFDPLTLTGPARFRAPPPPDLTSAKYTKDYNEVKALGALNGSSRTPEQTDIAWFWADNPVAIWHRGMRTLLQKRGASIGNSARLLALASIAAGDAVITAWDSKKYYVYWRPLSAIREGENDGNPDTAGDTTWQPFLNTPNYPDYTSGANNLSGAVTKSMELFFGRDDISFELSTAAVPAIKKTRHYGGFSAASQQVVNVRIYHGIHFRFADVEARKQGRAVAAFVHDHFLLPVTQ